MTYAAAVTAAAQILATARRTRDQLAADGGPQAVAQAAHYPGGPSRPDIAARYEALADQQPRAA